MITPPQIINKNDLLNNLEDCYFSIGEQRLEDLKHKRGRKPSLQSVMKSKEQKEEEAEFFRNLYKEHKALEESFKSLSYDEIEDIEYKDILIESIEEYNEEKNAYINYKEYCKTNDIKAKHIFYNTSIVNFVNKIKDIYKYEEIYSRIEYNDMHYAERGKDIILQTKDFIQFNKEGKPTLIKFKKHYGKFYDIIANYFRLFYLIYNKEKNKQNFQYIFWLTCNFINKTIIANDFNFSILDIYMKCAKLYSKTSSKMMPYPIRKSRLQKIFYEPGFEDEAKANYKKHKYDNIKNIIYAQFKGNATNEINIKNIQLATGLYDIVQKEIIEENVEIEGIEYGQTKIMNNEIEFKCERKIKELIKEMKNDEKYKDAFNNKKIERKKQNRSEWHKLIEEGKSYEEIIKDYPNIKKSTYYKTKSLLKNK